MQFSNKNVRESDNITYGFEALSKRKNRAPERTMVCGRNREETLKQADVQEWRVSKWRRNEEQEGVVNTDVCFGDEIVGGQGFRDLGCIYLFDLYIYNSIIFDLYMNSDLFSYQSFPLKII